MTDSEKSAREYWNDGDIPWPYLIAFALGFFFFISSIFLWGEFHDLKQREHQLETCVALADGPQDFTRCAKVNR